MKIITLNLRFTADRWQERFPMIVDLLHTEQPDIVGLQEVALKVQQAHLIQGALNYLNPTHSYKLRVANDTFDPPILANAMLSRHPVIDHERLTLPENFRIAHRITIQHQKHTLSIINTHLHHKPYSDESIRLPQMQAIICWIENHNHDNIILMGDMNARPESDTIHYAKQRFRSTFETANGAEPDCTFPTPLIEKDFQSRTLDYIFYSGNALTVKHSKLVANQHHPDDPTLYPSDHYGICTEFTL